MNEAIRLIEQLARINAEALAWREIFTKNDEAWKYIEKYQCGTIGENIWHSILNDAIKLRSEKN